MLFSGRGILQPPGSCAPTTFALKGRSNQIQNTLYSCPTCATPHSLLCLPPQPFGNLKAGTKLSCLKAKSAQGTASISGTWYLCTYSPTPTPCIKFMQWKCSAQTNIVILLDCMDNLPGTHFPYLILHPIQPNTQRAGDRCISETLAALLRKWSGNGQPSTKFSSISRIRVDLYALLVM